MGWHREPGSPAARFTLQAQVLLEDGQQPALPRTTEEPPASPREPAVPGQAACTMSLEKAGEGSVDMARTEGWGLGSSQGCTHLHILQKGPGAHAGDARGVSNRSISASLSRAQHSWVEAVLTRGRAGGSAAFRFGFPVPLVWGGSGC